MDNDRRMFRDISINLTTENMLTVNYNEAEYRLKARYMAIINECVKRLKEIQEKYWVSVLASDYSDKKLEDIPGFGYNYPFKCDISELKPNWGEYPCFAPVEEKDNNE